jgi:RNA polymerase sigma-70 factor (ECF subfamily)
VVPTPDSGDRDDPAPGATAGIHAAPLGHAEARAYVREAYDSLQRDVFSFALRSTRDPDVAADVTQDAFLRLLTEVERHGPPEILKAWLIRVASNLIISRGRRVSVAGRWLQRFGHRTETMESPEAALLREEQRDRVQGMLESLQPDARVCLLMAAEGFSGREIAASIGRTEQATRVLMSRARNRLRNAVAADEEAPKIGDVTAL